MDASLFNIGYPVLWAPIVVGPHDPRLSLIFRPQLRHGTPASTSARVSRVPLDPTACASPNAGDPGAPIRQLLAFFRVRERAARCSSVIFTIAMSLRIPIVTDVRSGRNVQAKTGGQSPSLFDSRRSALEYRHVVPSLDIPGEVAGHQHFLITDQLPALGAEMIEVFVEFGDRLRLLLRIPALGDVDRFGPVLPLVHGRRAYSSEKSEGWK